MNTPPRHPIKFLESGDFCLLALLTVLKVGICFLLLKMGYIAVSGDEFLRSLISHYWTEKPFFSLQNAGPSSAMWMPMHFWTVGSVLFFTGKIWETSLAVSLFFSVCSIVLLYCLGKVIGGRWVGAVSCVLVLFMPWETWLSIAALPSTIYHTFLLGGILALVVWEKKGRNSTWALFHASFCFLCSTMLRPEGWLFSVVFSSYLGVLALTSFQERKGLLLWALIPWIFPLYWLGCNAVIHGHPFWFILESRRAYQMEAADVDSPLLRLGQTPFTFFILSPLVVSLAVFAFVKQARYFLSTPHLRAYTVLFLGGFTMLVLAAVGGLGTNTAPQRFVIPLVLLAAITAAVFLHTAWKRGGFARVLVMAFFVLVTATDIPRLLQINTVFQADFRAGRRIREMISKGILSPKKSVCTEHELLMQAGIVPSNQLEMISRFCSDWAIRVGSNQPNGFTTNLDDQFRRDPGATAQKITTAFDNKEIGLVLVSSQAGRSLLPSHFHFMGGTGKWNFYTDQPQVEMMLDEQDRAYDWNRVNTKLTPGLELLEFGVEDSAFPKMCVLRWKTSPALSENYLVSLSYQREGKNAVSYTQTFQPFLGDYPTSRWVNRDSVIQYIPLPTENKIPAGKYRIHISVLTDQKQEPAEAVSPPVWIVASKRSALKSLLQGKEKNPALIWRVLISL